MISFLKSKDGYIYAYTEWFRVDENGFMVNNGKHVYIKYLWIHEKHRRRDGINMLITEIDKEAGEAEYVFWTRIKYDKRRTKNLSRYRLSKMGVRNGIS